MDIDDFIDRIPRILVCTAALMVILSCFANNFIVSIIGLFFGIMAYMSYSLYRENQELREWGESLERQLKEERGMW